LAAPVIVTEETKPVVVAVPVVLFEVVAPPPLKFTVIMPPVSE
jgi:hypothetical protein